MSRPDACSAIAQQVDLAPETLGRLTLKKVASQVIGDWKWYRQVLLTAIVLTMVALAHDPYLHDIISGHLNGLVPSLPAGTIRALLPDVGPRVGEI